MRVALTIAGSDSGGGAGIQADLRTFAACGLQGFSAVTAITAQNDRTIAAAYPLPPELVAAQIEVVAEGFTLDAVKTGMLATAGIVETVAERVARIDAPLVVDPVLVSSSGVALLDEAGVELLIQALLPRAAVATPNRMEAERLSGIVIASLADAETAARKIRKLGPAAVVVTGGHLDNGGAAVIDVVDDGARIVHLELPRQSELTRRHGTGCAHSAALAAALASGRSVVEAARHAQLYVGNLMRQAAGSGASAPLILS